MAKTFAERICETVGDYLLSTTMSPSGGDIQQKILSELNMLRSTMDPNTQRQFEHNVYIYNTQRGNFKGSLDEVLEQMHPWVLQRLVQKFRPLSALNAGAMR